MTVKLGAAWSYTQARAELLLGSNPLWYDSHLSLGYLSDRRCLPVIRWNTDDYNWWDRAMLHLPPDYPHRILLHNEPEQETQDNITPRFAADITRRAMSYWHNAKFIGPNCIWPEWLDMFLQHGQFEEFPFEKLGIHLYGNRADFPRIQLRKYKAILAKHGFPMPPIWVTETGFNSVGQAHAWLKVLTSGRNRIQRVYLFSPRPFAANDPMERYGLVDVAGQLTALGTAVREYV